MHAEALRGSRRRTEGAGRPREGLGRLGEGAGRPREGLGRLGEGAGRPGEQAGGGRPSWARRDGGGGHVARDNSDTSGYVRSPCVGHVTGWCQS